MLFYIICWFWFTPSLPGPFNSIWSVDDTLTVSSMGKIELFEIIFLE